MAVTAASVNPQQLRERLLQATDSLCNIHNMVAVLDVISTLEKYPITKEALEDTRLGKLVNDLRKKTRDEDLAKRAKKLLRSWQKLIKPQHKDILLKEPSSTVSSYRTQTLSFSIPLGNEKKSVFSSVHSCNTDKQSANQQNEQKAEKHSEILKVNKPPVSVNEEGPDRLSNDNPKLEGEKESASGVLKTAVLQRHKQIEVNITERMKPKSPGYSKTALHSTARKRPPSFNTFDSEPLSALPVNSFSPALHKEGHKDIALWENESFPKNERKFEPANNSQHSSKCSTRLQPGFLSEVTNMDNEKDLSQSEVKRRKSHFRDHSLQLEGRSADEAKLARVKNRKLTFDPITQQIRTLEVPRNKEPPNSVVDVNESLTLKQSPSTSSPSTLYKTNWKEVSLDETVKHYLNLQNNILKTSGCQSPQLLPSEIQEERVQESSKTHVVVPSYLEEALPGRNRDITTEDVHRINSKSWPGVNGCHDSRGNWYGWTECLSLDVYGDGSKLHILPYVCLD